MLSEQEQGGVYTSWFIYMLVWASVGVYVAFFYVSKKLAGNYKTKINIFLLCRNLFSKSTMSVYGLSGTGLNFQLQRRGYVFVVHEDQSSTHSIDICRSNSPGL